MIQLSDKHAQIVFEILAKYPYRFYAFGSRAKGTARPLSDLDVCVENEKESAIPLRDLAHLDADFEESDLPFKVDVVNWHTIDDRFKQLIEKDRVLLPKTMKRP